MVASVFRELRARPWAALCTIALALLTAETAPAAGCPGNPDAIGTSRTLVVDPRQYPIIGGMQYGKTLPLQDREVVLTFDDGPLPKYSNQVLNILAAHCAKATFFLVGSQANAHPEGVRKVRDAGHTVATHTQNHPGGMDRLPLDRAKQEVDQGIASVTAALADGTVPAPFFRIPGLRRNDAIEEHAASKGLQVWSADFPADDWRDVSAMRVYELAIQRLEAKGKGILLLHDIQARTVAALPKILTELKARGYRIVHVVPATPARPATPTEPRQWQLHPAPEMVVATSRWPKVPRFVFVGATGLPAPALSSLDWRNTDLGARAQRPARGVPLPRATPWPRQTALSASEAFAALPVPAASIFRMPEPTRVTMQAQAPTPEAPRTTAAAAKPADKSHQQARTATARPAAARPLQRADENFPEPAALAAKKVRSVRVAGLKKR